MGVLALIQAIDSDSATLATAQGAVVTAQAALDAANAVVANDETTVTSDDHALSAALQGTPGVFVLSADGQTAKVYQFTTADPGFTITTFTLAS